MGAVSLQLATVFQETIITAGIGQPATNTAAPTLNQTQGAPQAPQDTVTLSDQAAQAQQTHQAPQQQVPFQESILFAAEAQVQVFAPNNPDAANAQATETPEARATAQVPPATQLPDPAAAALANGNATGSAQTTGNTSQQELQQLDQTLQQLGINPQSISLFNRLALLLYANDPAALQQFVQQLQKGVQDVGEGNSAVTPGTQNQPQAQAQTQAQSLSQNQDSASAQTALSGQSFTAGQVTPGHNQTALSSVIVKLAELQLTFAPPSGQTQSVSTNSHVTTAPPASSNGLNGTSVNVTV
jgi:hypothetical protein